VTKGRIVRLLAPILSGLAAFLFGLGGLAWGHTGTTITGTFKTQEKKTPAQANLKQLDTIAGIAVYGTVDFVATDPKSKRTRELTFAGVTHLPQNVRGWIKADGVLINSAGAAGVLLVPTAGAIPAGMAHCATIFFNVSVDGRLKPTSFGQCKFVPDQASADWTALTGA